ncbi:hypothetical protein KAI87_10050 [Myxococcota bacterium]|nr:hypothetical protein [Myxococcota bacterium]
MSSVSGGNAANANMPIPSDVKADVQQTQSGQVSTTNISINDNAVSKETNALLNKAGLDSTNAVKDTASIGKAAEITGLSSSQQVYGTGEIQLKPPAPPRVDLNAEKAAGAESFAKNVSVVVDDTVKTMAANPAAANPLSDAVNAEITERATAVATEKSGTNTSMVAMAGEVIKQMGVAGTLPKDLSADQLLALFLKLNIEDPNMSVETQNELHGLMSEGRKEAIADARDAAKAATEAMKEAEKDADHAGMIGDIAMVVAIVCAIVVTIFTLGTGVGLGAALIGAAASIGSAAANKSAADSSADAQQASNNRDRSEMFAEMFQQLLEEQSAQIGMIIESKNKMMDSVIQMMNASFATQQKVVSAGMAK